MRARLRILSLLFSLPMALLVVEAIVAADDWSISRPAEPRPPSGGGTRAPSRPRTPPLSREERIFNEALADPLSEILVEELIAIEREKGEGIGALRARLMERAQAEKAQEGQGWRSRILLALIEYREGDQGRSVDALRELADTEGEGARHASLALARVAQERGEPEEERAHLLRAIERTRPGRERDELRERLARQALAHGEAELARAQVDALLEARPRDLGLREAWAAEYSAGGVHAEALRLIDSAIALRRGDLRSLLPLRMERARILHAGKESAAAIEEIRSILRQAGSAPYRMSLYELELEAHRALGSLEALASEMSSRRDVEAAIISARLYEELGRDEEAAAAYERALRQRGSDRDLRGAYARLLSRMGRIDDVLVEYDRLVRETRGDAYYTRELALLYDRLGRRDEALALLDRMARAQPRSAALAQAEAELREGFGDQAGMRAALERWKRAAPNDPEPRVVLAASYLAEGAEPKAIAELAPLGPRTLARPSDRAAALELARIYLDLDLAEHAEARLRELLAGRADGDEARDDEVRILLAEALIRPREKAPATQGQRRAEAIAIYEEILERGRAPRETLHETRRLLARLLRDDRRLDQAITLLEARLEREPEHEPSRLLLIEAYLARGDADLSKAVALLDDARARRGEGARTLETVHRLIEIRRREGARAEEMELLKELIALDPSGSAGHIDRLIELATLLYLDEEALHYAELAVRRSPSDAGAFRRLGAFYLDRSRLKEAAEAYRRALALDEFALETIEALARIALRMNEREAARGYYLRLLRLSPDDELIRSAGLGALRLSVGVEQLEELERLLVSLTSGLGAKRAHRSLLLPMYEALAGVYADRDEADREALGRRALSFLIEQLFEGDLSTTRRALTLLAELGPRGAADAILRFARSDANAGLRAEALLTYARLGAPISRQDAARFLAAEQPVFRRAAAWLVHQRGDVISRRSLLASGDSEIQALGLLSFFHRPDSATRAAIQRAFDGGHSTELRASATLALSRYDEPALRLEIAARAIASSPLERLAALYALQGADEPEARIALAIARLDPDPSIRELADLALSRFDEPALRIPDSLGDRPSSRRVILAIVEQRGATPAEPRFDPEAMSQAARVALHGSKERARAAMRELLRREGDPAMIPTEISESIIDAVADDLYALTLNDEAEIRALSAALITRASSDEASAALVRELAARGDEETLRRAIISINREPGPALAQTLKDIASGEQAWPARHAALHALSLSRAPALQEELGGFFEKIARHDTHSIVRVEAVSALSKIPSSRSRLRDLSETHPDPRIREQAKNAIGDSID